MSPDHLRNRTRLQSSHCVALPVVSHDLQRQYHGLQHYLFFRVARIPGKPVHKQRYFRALLVSLLPTVTDSQEIRLAWIDPPKRAGSRRVFPFPSLPTVSSARPLKRFSSSEA
jgi:hypothetical protein